jgi:hypothetical protein
MVGILAISSVAVRHRFDRYGTDPDQTFHFDAECRSRSHPTPNFSHVGKFEFVFLLFKGVSVHVVLFFSSASKVR